MVRESKIIFSSLLFLAACSDRPDREKFPGGTGRTTESQRAETQKAVLGGFDPQTTQLPGASSGGAAESTPPAGPAAGGGATEKKISGVIKIQKGLSLPSSGRLFISARNLQAGGPPVAVKRLPLPAQFPFSFELTEKDQMMADSEAFAGTLMVTARVDQDGDPLSRQPGDLSGSLEAQVGSSGLTIELKKND